MLLDPAVQHQTDRERGQRSDCQQTDASPARKAAARVELQQAAESPGIGSHHGQNGAHLNDNLECRGRLVAQVLFKTEPVACQNQVPRGGNRQELGEPLDQPHDDGFQFMHGKKCSRHRLTEEGKISDRSHRRSFHRRSSHRRSPHRRSSHRRSSPLYSGGLGGVLPFNGLLLSHELAIGRVRSHIVSRGDVSNGFWELGVRAKLAEMEGPRLEKFSVPTIAT